MFPDSPRPMSMVTSTKWAISGVRQSFEPFRKRVPSFDAPLHRSVATLRLTGSPAPSEADDVALAKGPRKAGGSNLYGSHPQESYAGAHRRQNQSWSRRGFSYSTASVTKWSSLSPSATAFAMSAAPWTSGFGSVSVASSISFNSDSP